MRSTTSTSRPILYMPRWLRISVRRRGLGIDQELVVGEAQDPHVALHLALAVEQRRVAALPRLERLDVVGQLSLQELGGLGAA